MGKSYGAQSRGDLLRFAPEQLTIVTETDSGVTDERAALPYDERMVRSILKLGQIDAIVIRENGRHPPREDGSTPLMLEIVDGRQRYKAIVEANKRLAKEGGEPMTIEAKVMRGAGDDAIARQVVVAANEIRIPDPPSVRARKVLRMSESGLGLRDIASAFGISTNQVKDLLTLAGLDGESKTAVDEGVLPLTSASKLEKLSNKERGVLVTAAKASPRGKKLAKAVLDKTAKQRSQTPTRVRTFRTKPEIEKEIARLEQEVASLRERPSPSVLMHPVECALKTLKWVLGEGEETTRFCVQ